jgi:geranylgeranyl pyrophosphate synthase
MDQLLTQSLRKSITDYSHPNELRAIMDYAVLPAGKLFRPRMVLALAKDLKGSTDANDIRLGCAIELHHAYTLVHDDLPAMDNDLIRRGKASTHAQFGEWKAILAGDSLLIASFQELMQIDHAEIKKLHRLFTWATGARGLISGQFLDLLADGKMDFSLIVRIHELKTARLIQVACLGSYLLSSLKPSLRETITFLRLGQEIGVTFQLLDDLTELTDPEVSEHENLINPFLLSPKEALKRLDQSYVRLQKIILNKNLKHLGEMLDEYFRNSKKKLESSPQNITKNLDAGVSEEVNRWITSFASA